MKFKWVGVNASETQSMRIIDNENKKALQNLGWKEVTEESEADVLFSFMHQGNSYPDLSGRIRIFYICSTIHNSLVSKYIDNYIKTANTKNNYIFTANHDQHEVFKRAGIKTYVWNHGVNMSDFTYTEKSPDELIFGFVGQGEPWKRHKAVVDAFLRAFTDNPQEAKLKLVTGWDRIEGYHSIPRNIELIHTINRNNMPNFYKSISCLLNFSYGENFNLTPIEGLSCGVPCFVTDMPSMHEDIYETRLHRIQSKKIVNQKILLGTEFCPKDLNSYFEPPWVYDINIEEAINALLNFEKSPTREKPLPYNVTWENRIVQQLFPVLEKAT